MNESASPVSAAGTPGKELVALPAATTEPPAGLFQAMLADPVHAPERLALEAVRICGPEAAAWAERIRRERPELTIAELAMRTRTKFTRQSQASGAATGALGLPGAAVDVAVSSWTQARMILYLAALHHQDPTDPERAAEILYFTGVHKAIALAETAVEVTAKRAPATAMLKQGENAGRSTVYAGMVLAVSLSKMLGRKAVKSLVTRAIPFGAIPLGAWTNGRAMSALADRVVTEYARRLGVIIDHRSAKSPRPIKNG